VAKLGDTCGGTTLRQTTAAVKLYALALGAWRTSRQDIESDVKVAMVLAESEQEARLKGKQIALQTFPDSEEWFDWRVDAIEIPQAMRIDGYRLTWQIEENN
jgi:hypothetical protein